MSSNQQKTYSPPSTPITSNYGRYQQQQQQNQLLRHQHQQQQQQQSSSSYNPSRPTSPIQPVYMGIPILGFFRPPSSFHTTPATNNTSRRRAENKQQHHLDDETLPFYNNHNNNNININHHRRYSQSVRDVPSSSSSSIRNNYQNDINQNNYGSIRQPSSSAFSSYSERLPPSYYSNLYRQSLLKEKKQQQQQQNQNDSTSKTEQQFDQEQEQIEQRRTGIELWNIVRFHVQHETFHIDSAYWHDDVCGTTSSNNNCFDDHNDTNYNNNDPQQRRNHGTTTMKKSLLLFTQNEFENYENLNEMNLPYDFTIRDCIIALIIYLCISIIAYSFVFEHWSIIDSMYFACVSFTTIGYGDLSPSTTAGRFFCIFFALGGVAVLAIALGVLGSQIIENEIIAMESTKHKIVDEIITRLPKQFQPKQKENPKILLHSSSSNDNPNQQHHHHSSFDYLRDFDDPTIHDDYDDYNYQNYKIQHQIHEFCILFSQLMCRYIPALLPLFIGSLIIGHNEGWSIIDSIYYCVVTTTTIGYGDRVPQHESMKLFAVIFIPLSVGAMGHFLGTVANFIIEQRRKAFDKRLWKHELTIQDLHCMSSTNDGVVSELDFVIFMLQAMKKVDKDLIDHIRHHFHTLDLTNSNTLCRDDLELMAKKKLRSVKTKLRMSTYRQSLSKQCTGISSASESSTK